MTRGSGHLLCVLGEGVSIRALLGGTPKEIGERISPSLAAGLLSGAGPGPWIQEETCTC